MLHNTGPYGPNEQPMNVGAPVNMTSVRDPLSAPLNLNTLSKMSQHQAQAPSGHYNLPNYANYNHPALNMPPQMSPFSSYPLGFPNNFASANPHDSTWSNGMLPMNLNSQSSHAASMLNHHHNYDKRSTDTIKNIDKDPTSNVSLNIPQVPTKFFQRQSESNNESYNTMFDNSYKYIDHDFKKINEKIHLDDTRRRSLENTVKLIENILINSTSKQKSDHSDENNDSDQPTNMEVPGKRIMATEPGLKPAPQTTPLPLEKVTVPSIEDENDDNDNDTSKQENTVSDESSDEDMIPISQIKLEEEESIANVVVKVEPTFDLDFGLFHKDPNGILRENAADYNIVERDHSVNDAVKALKDGLTAPTYFECPHCYMLFLNPKRFLIHAKWHTFGQLYEKRKLQAQERAQRTLEKREARLLEKMNAKEVSGDYDGQEHSCKDCDKIFKTKSSLKNHRHRAHPTVARECRICNKTMHGWAALRAHLTTHSTESSNGFQCSDCPKRFKYLHSLAKHRDTHLEKTHQCPECPKMFGSAALLKMHSKTHERAARGATFRCSYCAKGFYEAYNLAVHERTHRNERPYTCTICNTSFGTNSSLKRHMKVSHSSSKPWECATCHRSFITEAIRDRHETRVHGDPSQFSFTCDKCPRKYMKQKDLQKHIYKVHPKGRRKKKVKSDSE